MKVYDQHTHSSIICLVPITKQVTLLRTHEQSLVLRIKKFANSIN